MTAFAICPPSVSRPAGASRSARRGASAATCAAIPGQQLSVHVGETTIAFPMDRQHVEQLQVSLGAVMQTFAEKQKAERPRRWDSMEYRFKGEPGSNLEQFEVICNPNAHPTAFDAKFLLTLRTAGGVKVTTEGKLSALKADVDSFLDKKS